MSRIVFAFQIVLYFLLSLAITSPSFASNEKHCEKILLTPAKNHSTESFIAYLGQLVETQTIGDSELIALIESIERDSIENPISEEQTWVSTTHLIHRDEIQKYLHDPNLDRQSLLAWAKSAIKEKYRIQVKRDQVQLDTKDVYQKIELHPVPPSKFQMGKKGNKVKVTLTHTIEAMSTQVTQKHWVDLMGENPSFHVEGENTIEVIKNGRPIKMQPDNPVENITWWSAIVFANKLSESRGLPPVYDLNGIDFVEPIRGSGNTSFSQTLHTQEEIFQAAAKGTLQTLNLEVSPKINGRENNIYETAGYRFPTDAEQEMLLRLAKLPGTQQLFLNSGVDIKEFGWLSDNSKERTHPVALLKPLLINGKEFFDLIGNVQEWGQDWYGFTIYGGENPTGPLTGLVRVTRGESITSYIPNSDHHYRKTYGPSIRSFVIGFRMVRTLR